MPRAPCAPRRIVVGRLPVTHARAALMQGHPFDTIKVHMQRAQPGT
jgi:hypothetical protein